MNTKNLMVGDWIYAIDDDGNRHPCRANNLAHDYVNNTDDFCVDFSKTGYETEWPDVMFDTEPIPLTKELLEKNGFVYDPNSDEEDDGWWQWRSLGLKDGNEYISVAFRGDDVAVYDLMIMKGSNDGNLHRNYVHELQQAIRLFGISKEIEL